MLEHPDITDTLRDGYHTPEQIPVCPVCGQETYEVYYSDERERCVGCPRCVSSMDIDDVPTLDAEPAIPFGVRRLSEDFCLEIGLPCANQGFETTVAAVALVAQSPRLLHNLSGKLYPAVADAIGEAVHVRIIQRRIDSSITEAFSHDRGCDVYKHFKGIIRADKGKPTIGEFLRVGSRYVADRMNPTP